MLFPILLLSFILVPVIEIMVLIKVGSSIGLGATILFVIFTAVLGAYLVRQQGFATIHAVQNELNQGRVPAKQMAEGVALLFAGAVLLTPGFVTDAIGFALLTPPIRRAVINWVVKQGTFSAQTMHASHTSYSNTPDQTQSSTPIEGEYRERD